MFWQGGAAGVVVRCAVPAAHMLLTNMVAALPPQPRTDLNIINSDSTLFRVHQKLPRRSL